MDRSARLGPLAFGVLLIAYHDGCIKQDVPHRRHILQHHGNPEWSNNLERCMEIVILWQRDEVLRTSVSHKSGSGEGLVLTLL
jgi:hypothetical protein